MSNPTLQQGQDPSGVVSFMPEEYVRDERDARNSIVALLIFGVVLVATAGAFAFNSQAWKKVERERDLVAAEYADEQAKLEMLKELEVRRGQLLDKAGVVAALLDPVPRSVLLAELLVGKPQSATLTEISLSSKRIRVVEEAEENPAKTRGAPRVSKPGEQKAPRVLPPRFEHTLVLDGIADRNNDVADYLASLETSPIFRSVDLKYINEGVRQGREVRQFRVELELDPEAHAEAVLDAGRLGDLAYIPGQGPIKPNIASEFDVFDDTSGGAFDPMIDSSTGGTP